MSKQNATPMMAGLLVAVGSALYGLAPASAEQTASTIPAASYGEPYLTLPTLPKAGRTSPVERILDAIAAEVHYSGTRLTRIAAGARESVLDTLRGEPATARPQADTRRAPTSANEGAGRPSRGPSDAALGEMADKLYALRTPSVSAWPERPAQDAARPQPPAQPAAPGLSTGSGGSAEGARRLLRRLEQQGDMDARPASEGQNRFVAALPPGLLDPRFDSWPARQKQTPADEDIYGFSSECPDGNQRPGGPMHLASMPHSGSGDQRSAAARRTSGEKPADRTGAGVAHLTAMLPDSPRRLSDGSVFMPKLTQRLLNVRTVMTCVGKAPRIEQLIGKIISNPNASGLVQAGQVGRIRPGPQGLPEIGMRVREGQPLGILMPSLTTVERGKMESELAELRGEIIRKELALARMRDFPIVPFRTGRMLALRLELDGLRKRRDPLIAGIDNHEVLLSPMDGVISRATVVAGQLVHAGDTLWQVVDPKRMRVEAIAFDEAVARNVRGAWALTSENEVMRLSFIGRSMNLMNQGIPLHFEIRDHPEGLSVGTPVSVYVSATGGEAAVILPKGALVRDDAGRTVVWEHIDGERFVPRPVHAEPLNGWQVVVLDGIADNARVVHIGSTHLSQIR